LHGLRLTSPLRRFVSNNGLCTLFFIPKK